MAANVVCCAWILWSENLLGQAQPTKWISPKRQRYRWIKKK